MVEQ
jgi:hypothetical protein